MAFKEVARWSGIVAIAAEPPEVLGEVSYVQILDPVTGEYTFDAPQLIPGQVCKAHIVTMNPVGSLRSARYYLEVIVTDSPGSPVAIDESGEGLGGSWDSIREVWVGVTSDVAEPGFGWYWGVMFTVDAIGSYMMEAVLYAEGT